jgi:deazaflavin-dependent oxidoreductase (nitroreductase family)
VPGQELVVRGRLISIERDPGEVMPAPRWLARVNLYTFNRLLGPLAKRLPGMGVIVHLGRKTHRRYRTPVLIFKRDHHFIIALTYGRESEWVQNVLAEGGCDVETAGRSLHVIEPRLLHDTQRRIMPRIVRVLLGVFNVSDFLEVRAAA